jgi:CubicO group peptidase (beta-lactamase class C family)
MRKDTIFQIMSMTKPVTAIGIMMLAEGGKLTLRDPVEQYLPEFRGVQVASNAGPDASRLRTPDHAFTIRDLMTHNCGHPRSRPCWNLSLSPGLEPNACRGRSPSGPAVAVGASLAFFVFCSPFEIKCLSGFLVHSDGGRPRRQAA